MSLSAKIREQLVSGFRSELAEHVQTMNTGLLALEQNQVADDQRRSTLEEVFRAAHSLKGAARAVGVTAVEQLAHALEDVLAAMQNDAVELIPALFTACYKALDAVQAVQAAYESGETTPPTQVLVALSDLDAFRPRSKTPVLAQVEDAVRSSRVAKLQASALELVAPAPVPAPRQADTLLASEAIAVAAPGAWAGSDGVGPQGNATIRVSVSKLDALMAQLSELLVTKIRAEQHMAQMRQAQAFMAQWQKDWLAARSAYNSIARKRHQAGTVDSPTLGGGTLKLDKDTARVMNYVGVNQERLREMNTLVNSLSREYDNDTLRTSLVIDALEQDIKRVRMLPLAMITPAFGRMVRDLAQAAGKEASLEIVGGDVELDKRVLEQIKDPLIHLLRNAIDHGIETPDTRVAMGKPRAGLVTLTAEQRGRDVIISVSDDGAGLNIEAIRHAAMRRGEASQVQTLGDAELVELIYNSGFSTSRIITDVSGRGVGLDIVRRNVEALNGRISVDWTPGAGSTFKLTLPLTLTSSRGLLVRASNQTFAIPLNSIDRILHLRPEEITPMGGHDTVRYGGRPLPLVRLNDVLGLPRHDALYPATHAGTEGNGRIAGRIAVVILAAAERRMAFAVDDLAGEQEVVIKTCGKQLARVGGIAGATVMGNGQVMLILNVADLIKLAMRGERRSVLETTQAAAGDGQPKARILIVDDSVTTRTLEKNILEAAGYHIQIATDGQEALSAMAVGSVPDLVISDIFMPRVDGFALTKRIKEDARTAKVPVILVTSLDSAEDKSRGIQAGADAYIVKSRFDQNNLLETIQQLI